MIGKFVSINICVKRSETDDSIFLLNPTNTPLIYWWNPKENFIDSLFNEKALKEYLQDLCIEDSYIYENAKLYWFYLEDEDTEEYSNKELALQEIFPITILDKEKYYDYFTSILKELYEDVYKEPYLDEIEDLDEKVKDIYNKIISGVKRPILLETVSNYIYKTIKERTHLNNENITQLIKIFNNIIERTQ